MVITCPSCAARYRLNPDKVQGRGAKITCPKCSHVFVVFTDQDGEGATKPAPSPPKVRTPPRPAAPPTTETDKRTATQTGAFRAVGIAPADDSIKRDSKSNVRIVAPGPRSTRRMRTLSTPAAAAPRGPSADSLPSKAPATADMKIGSASELDFRSVGIKTWKVKVAIGLIYDFSDISTLQKYLADKKVTPDDLISHNNADWTRIGDIEDLDAHFVQTWRTAKAAIDSGEAPAPKKKKEKPAEGAAPVGTSTDSFRIDTNRGRSTGNYPAPAPPRRRAPEPEEEDGGNKRALMILAAVLVVGGLAWAFLKPADTPLASEPTPPVALEDLGPTDAELKEIQEGIAKELEEQRERLKQEVGATDPTEIDGDAARELVPVPPSERRDPVPIQQPDPVIPPRQKYTPPPAPKDRVVEKAPVESKGTIKQSKPKGNPSAVYLSAGDKKLAAGDFNGALSMYKLAISKDPSCGPCYAGKAKAEKGLGNASGAAAAEQKAQELKSPQSMASP